MALKLCSLDFCKDCKNLGWTMMLDNKIYTCTKVCDLVVFGFIKDIFEQQKRPENCIKDNNHKQIDLPFRRVKCNRQTI